jgi:hypothetical protein
VVAAAVLDAASGPQAIDLRRLHLRYQVWRERINLLLERNEAEGDDAPPAPGPIINRADLQKGRWGGIPERNGRRLEAEVTDVQRATFNVDLIVRSSDGSPLDGPVLFHLHDTYPRKTIHIRGIRDGNFAVLEEVTAYGTYTVGAQVKAAVGRWASLELDLATVERIPSRFVGR